MISSTRFDALAALACAALLGGCATGVPRAERTMPAAASAVELESVPFFPQSDYQCGPAALATVLAHAGRAVDDAALVDEVYVAGLKGSLQAEMLGATRRHALIPYLLPPEAGALLAELEAGRPVLVLQNLGLARWPVWHYAVMVGFDPERERAILRSGTERRRIERSARFLSSWRRADSWAFVALEAGELPAAAEPGRYVRALSGAEPFLPRGTARAAHDAALERWPADTLVLFAAAASRHGDGDLPGAAALYRRLLDGAPRDAAARNNLANVLLEQGCAAAAVAEARAALDAVAPDSGLQPAIRDTLASAESAAGAAATPAHCT